MRIHKAPLIQLIHVLLCVCVAFCGDYDLGDYGVVKISDVSVLPVTRKCGEQELLSESIPGKKMTIKNKCPIDPTRMFMDYKSAPNRQGVLECKKMNSDSSRTDDHRPCQKHKNLVISNIKETIVGGIALPRFGDENGNYISNNARDKTIDDPVSEIPIYGLLPHPLDTPSETANCYQCGLACSGSLMYKYTMMKGSYKIKMHLSAKTKWIIICFSPQRFEDNENIPKCNFNTKILIFVKHGFVLWPNRYGAGILDFGGSSITYLEFGFGISGRPDFYVTNRYGDTVRSNSRGYSNAEKLFLHFSSKDDVLPGFGIVSMNLKQACQYSESEKEVLESSAQVQAVQGDTVESGDEFTMPEEEEVFEAVTFAPTEAPPSARIIRIDKVVDESDLYEDGQWLTWALYFGSVVSSFLCCIIGSLILYFMRRTVYACWYKGMYKRYGCDASGTTGGVTGVGFGEMTGTTMGATGGTSTMGTTGSSSMGTTGTTGTSTMGGTSTVGGTTGGATESMAL